MFRSLFWYTRAAASLFSSRKPLKKAEQFLLTDNRTEGDPFSAKQAFGVEDVVSSHEKGTTVIHAPEKLDEDKIREVIKEAGYEVTGITQE